MARHHLGDPRVQAVTDALVRLTLTLGSVNAVAEMLSGNDADDGPIYANRLHGLLAGDPTRSVNSSTLESLEKRLGVLNPAVFDDARIAAERARIAAGVAAEALTAGNRSEALMRAAERLHMPLGAIQYVDRTGTHAQVPESAPEARPTAPRPDWSWQTAAVEQSLTALGKGARHKAALVIPTGGGKTRIALQVALRWLAARRDGDEIVLWVTHRRHLRTQARRTLQKLLVDPAHVQEGVELFLERIRFVMVQDLSAVVAALATKTGLVIVDEAHHAAAPSYRPIFDEFTCPALFLTATPNRADERSIGIDEICYTITYRELFDRGCLVEPSFEPPLDMPDLDWSRPEGMLDLADYLLDRADGDFTKSLVVVGQQHRAEVLHQALLDLLTSRSKHVLTPENIGFVHGGGTSGAGSPEDFLDEFSAWPRGIVVATGQFVGEGFDDPTIDAIVVTYPSTSISHLMQLAGRALRDSPGKQAAHIVQVRESPLEYHFEQRWLYQDISDALHPVLIDRTYVMATDLEAQVHALLEAHQVAPQVSERVLNELGHITPGQTVNMLLSGLPYFGDPARFDEEAHWGAVLIADANRSAFLDIFNDVSYRTEDLKDFEPYLKRWIRWDPSAGSAWKSYVDLVEAMEYARREIVGIAYAGGESRPYAKPIGTTWLRYATFKYAPRVPASLEAFLADAVNRTEILSAYEASPQAWALVLKVELPLAGSIAFLLDANQRRWFEDQRGALARALADTAPLSSIETLDGLCRSLGYTPIPLRLINEFRQLLRPERFDRQSLRLLGASTAPD